MSEQKRKEFYDLVKQAHDAIDEYAEGFVSGDWFIRDLDHKAVQAAEKLVAWSVVSQSCSEENQN